jgi:hypothetical protein
MPQARSAPLGKIDDRIRVLRSKSKISIEALRR